MRGTSTIDPSTYLGAYADPTEVGPSALLENAIYRLDRIANTLGEGNKTLADLRSRTFGPWPESAQASGNIREASAPTTQARLSEILDRLDRAAQDARDHAHSLNSSL